MVRDILGNELKEGALVIMSYNNSPTVARVVQIEPTGVIATEMPVPGQIVLQIIVPIMLNSKDEAPVWVLARPSNQELAVKKMASEVPS